MFKHQRTISGNFGRKIMRCSKCGTVIEVGNVYFSRVTKRRRDNTVEHICEKCYEKQFITV